MDVSNTSSTKVSFSGKIKEFFCRNFKISSTKKSKITGFVISVVFLIFVVFERQKFIALNFEAKWLLLAFALIAPVIIGLYIAYSIKIVNDKLDKVWHLALIFLLPFLTITMTECLNNTFIYDMTYLGFLGNYIVVLLFYFLIFAICGSLKVSVLVVNSICFGLALAHCYILEFRGTPFVPMDFLSITTAVNVGNTYNYSPTYTMVIGLLIFVFILVLGIKIKTPKYSSITKIVSRTFMGTFFACIIGLFYFTSVFADAGVRPDFWNQSRGYRNYGFVLSFFCNTKYLYMSEPNGYDASSVGDYVSSTVSNNSENSSKVTVTGNEPNVICIMNESLSDLSILGDFTTNQDYMPFMRSLTKNTVKGNLYVPVIGAGTSNTEFEFITGNSTAFLPSGSNAYMLYVKNPLASLVSTLEAQGYSSLALHPYYANGWNRIKVYNNFGFNKFTSLENLVDVSILNDYVQNGSDADYLQSLIDTYYPDRQNMLIRQYVSDSYDYSLIIDDYENRDKSTPYFVFNVTMQNHGGYTKGASNFDECITITSSDVYYNKASKYLSLVKASDDAFKGLIEYFSKVKEPTVICMFGDHQPSIETEFISSVMGVNNLNNLTLEQEQARHVTPFFIWANYDIESKYIDKLSSNYLSSYLLDIAGLKLTEYNKYLLKLSETLPVIDTVGYIDSNNTYYRWSDKSEYRDVLNEYEKIQYNNIFDTENRRNDIFYIEGYVPPVQTDSEEQTQ